MLKTNQHYTDLPKVKLLNNASYQKTSEKYTKLRIWQDLVSNFITGLFDSLYYTSFQ